MVWDVKCILSCAVSCYPIFTQHAYIPIMTNKMQSLISRTRKLKSPYKDKQRQQVSGYLDSITL